MNPSLIAAVNVANVEVIQSTMALTGSRRSISMAVGKALGSASSRATMIEPTAMAPAMR